MWGRQGITVLLFYRYIYTVYIFFIFWFFADQQADRVLPAAGSPREAGERQEEVGQETTVHATGILGILLPQNPTVQMSWHFL